MNRNLAIVVVLVVVIGAGLWARDHFSPENVVKRALLDAASAFEEGEFLSTIKVIDRGYRDGYGLSYEALAGNVRVLQENCDDLELDLEIPGVQVHDAQALMQIRFVLRGTCEGESGNMLGSRWEPCTATLGWAKQPQGWRIVSTADLQVPEHQDEIDRMSGSR